MTESRSPSILGQAWCAPLRAQGGSTLCPTHENETMKRFRLTENETWCCTNFSKRWLLRFPKPTNGWRILGSICRTDATCDPLSLFLSLPLRKRLNKRQKNHPGPVRAQHTFLTPEMAPETRGD